MKTNRRTARTLMATGLLGAALAIGAGATPAEAKKHHQGHRYHPHHSRVVVQRHYYPAPVVVHRTYYPRPVVVRTYRPWYQGVNRVYVGASPYYFHAGLNLFIGGTNLNFAFTDYAPDGYVYVDPYCDEDFYSVAEYRDHCRHYGHRAALQVEYVGN